MEIVEDLPQPVRTVEHVTIEASDGTRLAGRLWLPAEAEESPVPVIVEYIPYRRRDGTRLRDDATHGYLAGHGYACLRVDVRGSGDSGGVLPDEYTEREMRDGENVLAWAAEQRWCDGSAGMMGISWGGFHALQLAARRPPQLKAVAAVSATDDRYRDDIHYMGGCLLGDNLSWASVMFSFNTAPPDPEVVGPAWREMWHRRLDRSGLWLETWLEHQRRDDYWRHGSICEDHGAVDVPVFVASGWADGYTNAVFRMLEHLDVPRLGLVGPWGHHYPHLGYPGPAVGFLQEMVRWWDRWLKGVENGIEDEPMLRAWMQDSVGPLASYDERPGRWIVEPSWPSPHVDRRAHELAPGGRLLPSDGDLDPEGAVTEERELCSPLTTGLHGGKWFSYGAPADMPGDQRLEDGGSLVFDSDPLGEDVEVLGAPAVDLTLSADRPVAMVAVRLSDVFPDGRVNRVTFGLLNLTHRDGHAEPRSLVPGEPVQVRVGLNHVGYRFPTGHRLRVALSTSYWPLAWLPPEPVTLTVLAGACGLVLPVRSRPNDPALTLLPPQGAPRTTYELVGPTERHSRVVHDLSTGTATLEVVDDRGSVRYPDLDLEYTRHREERYSVRWNDVTSACGETQGVRTFRRGDWSARAETRTVLTCDRAAFHIEAELSAYEGEERVFHREWQRTIARDHV